MLHYYKYDRTHTHRDKNTHVKFFASNEGINAVYTIYRMYNLFFNY